MIPQAVSTIVWKMIIEAKTNKEIARQLGTTEDRVKSYVRKLLKEQKARNRVELAVIGVKQGIA